MTNAFSVYALIAIIFLISENRRPKPLGLGPGLLLHAGTWSSDLHALRERLEGVGLPQLPESHRSKIEAQGCVGGFGP
jgi:hypothetical protein